ncbi:MAG: recombinase family protein [Oscillospiraceae bacterium]|jgi:DNA invertase Pin-like site-specific DNA recombinase|nr:recombinase family protein [Oscillospiraceae bacterium]
MARIRKPLDAGKTAPALWRTGIYIRLSKDDGNDESYSVQNQRQRLSAHFDSTAPEESMRLVDFYIDDGYTGTDSDRDSFQRLLTDIDSGKINCVIVKDLSRLSRNDWECKRYLQHLFVVKDVRFISLELPRLDSYKRPDEIYDLGVTMQSAYNENHCRETSIKVRGTFNTKRRAGEFIGAFAPYGYLKDPADKHHFVVDEETAPVIRDIFHWFVCGGMSKNGIVKRLIELGVLCPSAYKRAQGMNYHNPQTKGEPLWSARTVSEILGNRMYLGHMVQGRQKVKSYKIHTRVTMPEQDWFVVEDTHEAIIDAETFAKAQSLMLRDTRTPPDSGQLYTFSGFLRCADCGKSMCRRTAKNLVYYACRTKLTTGLCTRHSIRHDKLESIVLQAIQAQIALVDGLSELIDAINDAPVTRTVSKRLNTSLKQRRQDLERLSALRTGLYVDWKNSDITRDEYRRMKQEFEDKEGRLARDISALEEESQVFAQSVTTANPYFDAFRRHRNITSLNRGIVAELINVIHIHEGGDVTIDFNFADQHRRALEFAECNGAAERGTLAEAAVAI